MNTLLAVACAIYAARVVRTLLTLLSAEWSSYGAVVTASTVGLAALVLFAVVRSASRRSRRNIGV
jgi:hypothetical protein